MTHPEIGAELKSDQLEPGTIVVTSPEHRPELFATMWVDRVDKALVWLRCDRPNGQIHLGLLRQADGSLKDDGGRQIKIFRYLGEP